MLTDHFFDEAGYIEELKTIQPEAILCRTEPITAAMMDAAGPNLKVIAKQGAGLDNIDVEAATARKIPVVTGKVLICKGAYYGFCTGKTGKVKVVGKGYVPSSDDKSTIIYYTK